MIICFAGCFKLYTNCHHLVFSILIIVLKSEQLVSDSQKIYNLGKLQKYYAGDKLGLSLAASLINDQLVYPTGLQGASRRSPANVLIHGQEQL